MVPFLGRQEKELAAGRLPASCFPRQVISEQPTLANREDSRTLKTGIETVITALVFFVIGTVSGIVAVIMAFAWSWEWLGDIWHQCGGHGSLDSHRGRIS